MLHSESSPLADTVVKVGVRAGMPVAAGTEDSTFEMRVEDWWDRINGKSWQVSDNNFAALNYAMGVAGSGLPWDDEVLYGHSVKSGLGYLFHVKEIVEQ